MGALENALALRIIEQLVFVEYATFTDIEIVAVGMSLCGILVARGYLFIAHGTDGKSPLDIALTGQKITTSLHSFFNLLFTVYR